MTDLRKKRIESFNTKFIKIKKSIAKGLNKPITNFEDLITEINYIRSLNPEENRERWEKLMLEVGDIMNQIKKLKSEMEKK